MHSPGLSFNFSAAPFPVRLYCGPLSKFTFSGQYVPGAAIIRVKVWVSMMKNIAIEFEKISKHTWNVIRLQIESFAGQTVLRSFVQIYLFWTISPRCCMKESNQHITNVNSSWVYSAIIKWSKLPGVLLDLSKGVRSPKLYFGAASNFTFSGEYAPGAENFVILY